jgi:hypothetical protein
MYANTTFTKDDWDQEALNQQVVDTQNYAREEAARNQALQESVKSETAKTKAALEATNADGTLKSTHDTKAPKQYGLKENAQEAGNAVLAGAQDVVNSVTAIPQKIVDPRFYGEAKSPYKPAWVPFAQDQQPITKTVWGKFLRGAVEMGGLMWVTRKAAGGAAKVAGTESAIGKGLTYVAKGSPVVKGKPLANLAKTAIHGAVLGAPADLVSSYSTESNMAAELIKIRPDWEDALKPFSTHERMSPATRSLYNMFEGIGLGAGLDIAVSGVSAGMKSLGRSFPSPKPTDAVINPNTARYDGMREKALKNLEFKVTEGAKYETEKAFIKDPTVNKSWQLMTTAERYEAKQLYASRKGIEYADDTHPALKRQDSQDNAEINQGVARLEADPQGEKGFDAYINSGGDVHQGRALSSSKAFVDSMRSADEMTTNWADLDGTPINFITERELDRINSTPGGKPITREEYMDVFKDDPVLRKEIADLGKLKQPVDSFAPAVFKEFDDVIAGRKALGSMSDQEFESLFTRNYDKYGNYAGRAYYSNEDHLKAAVLTKVLNHEIRDLAKLGKSVVDQVDITAKDGTMDLLLSRYTAVGIGLKQSRYLRSISLSDLKNLNGESNLPIPGGKEIGQELKAIADKQNTTTQIIRESLQADSTDELLKLMLDAFSSNDKLSTWQDLDTFFANKLVGYKDGDGHHQSAIQRELGAMIIHSVISGPKTPVRAVVGTGLVTMLRPAQTAIGAMLSGDQRSLRGAHATMSGMFESVGESLKIFRAQLKSNFSGAEMADLNTVATHFNRTDSDAEWETMGEWVKTRGSEAHQAAYGWANTLRGMNNNPFLTWSSKVMGATDAAFQHLIGRTRLREIAYHKAYDSITEAGGLVSDANMPDLVRKYETAFYDEVFDQNGMLSDSLAKYTASEATMTRDLPKIVEAVEKAFNSNPWTKPFMLFTRTGYNALELVGKHTPGLNRFIEEVAAIKSLPTGHPDLMKYGITTFDEHQAAKALVRGREAMGAAVVTSAVGLYMSGGLTGNGPSDKTLRDAWRQQKWEPRSIRIGGQWVSYDALEPFNSFLAMVADVGDTQKEMGGPFVEKMLGRMWYLLQANVVNKSFLFGLSQLSDVLGARDSDQLGTVAGSMLNSYVPMSSMRNEIGKLFNPGMRELESGFQDAIKNRNLWAGELADLPYKYDVLNGQPLKLYDWPTRAWNAVMPFQVNTNGGETREMLWRSLYDVKMTVNTNPESGEIPAPLKSKWQMMIGRQNVEAQLAELFKNPQIRNSIIEMELARSKGSPNDPMSYLHNQEIHRIFKNAKSRAWEELSATTEASALIKRNAIKNAAANLRKSGNYTQAEQAQQLLNLPYGK